MSKEAVVQVVQRAISDGAFRRQLSTDPTGALRGFDLTSAETAAIRSGDSGRLTAFGVDVRMSKAFNLGGNEGGSSVVSNVVSSDLDAGIAGSVNSSLTSGDGTSGSGALISGEGATGSGALAGGGGAFGENALISGDTSDTDPMISGGNEIGRAGVIIPGDPAHAFGVVTDSDGGSALSADADQYNAQLDSALTSDDGAGGGASMPGEAHDGPEIQP